MKSRENGGYLKSEAFASVHGEEEKGREKEKERKREGEEERERDRKGAREPWRITRSAEILRSCLRATAPRMNPEGEKNTS